MKQVIFVLVGVVLGFMLGGIGPRQQLSSVEDELTRVQDELVAAERKASRRRAPRSFVPGFDQVLPEPDGDWEEDEFDGPEEDDEGSPDAVAGEGPEVRVVGEEDVGPTPRGSLEDFDLAADAQRLRSEQSRAALQQAGDLSDADMDELDAVFGDMNERLSDHAYDVLDLALAYEEPTPRDLLGISHDVTGILYESQVALEELVGEESLGDVDERSAQIWNYIDLESFRPAMEELIEAGVDP